VCGAFLDDPLVCDDGDPCTADGCAGECTHTPLPGCCHEDRDCDDGEPCTTDVCDPAQRCVRTVAAEGSSCSSDVCDPASCTHGLCTPDPPPVGYAGVHCALDAFATLLDEGSRTREVRRSLRGALRRLLHRGMRRLDAAGRAHRDGRAVRELRALKSVGSIVARLGRLVDRAEHRRTPAISKPLAARMRGTLGSARGELLGVQASFPPA
jgi:hypothetical protein